MSWIQERLQQTKPTSTADKTGEGEFAAKARLRWQRLGAELEGDVEEFSRHQSGTGFARDGENSFRVSNSRSGLELTLIADFKDRTVRYSYSALNTRTAGVPEGGILSMRQHGGAVEFYSADERLTSEETRQVLLEPMLFPRQMAS
jgi:hypothetical protein